jgi:hypothetical protein
MVPGSDGDLEDAASQDSASQDSALAYPTYTCSAGDAGPFDGSALESTTIVPNAILPTALTVAGGSIYWVEIGIFNGPAAAIKSVPTVGGPVTTVYTDDGEVGLPPALATDGTALYFVAGEYSNAVVKCDLTGPAACGADASTPQTVAGGGWGPSTASMGNPDQLFLLDGTIYFGASTPSFQQVVLAVAPDGGQTELPTAFPSASSLTLLGASPFGVYYAEQETGEGPLDLWALPVDGGQASLLAQSQGFGSSDFFDVAVVGGVLYMSNGSSISSQPAAAPGDGGGGAVLPIDGLGVIGMVADANGMYVASSSGWCAPGIYAVSLTTGAVTLVQQDPTLSAITSLALDANNVYWSDGDGEVDDGGVTGSWAIHAKAR